MTNISFERSASARQEDESSAQGRLPSNGQSNRERRDIASLDGLRALAIALVVIRHASSATRLATTQNWAIKGVLAVGANAHFGVTVFFVISGYLITLLLLREQVRDGRVALGQFYFRRIFRICPAFYTFILVVLALSAAGFIHVTIGDAIRAGTFTWLYNFGVWNWYLGHSWSLSVEEQFYFFWPAAIVILGRRQAGYLACSMICLTPLARAGFLLGGPKWFHRVCYIGYAGRFDLLMFGCVTALLWKSCSLERALAHPLAHVVCGTLATLAVFVAAVQEFSPIAGNQVWYAAFADSVVGLGIAAGLSYVVRYPQSVFGRPLNWPLVAWIGTLSYSLYLWQQLFLTPQPIHAIQRLPLNVVGALLAAIASFYLVERPLVALRLRIQRRSGRHA